MLPFEKGEEREEKWNGNVQERKDEKERNLCSLFSLQQKKCNAKPNFFAFYLAVRSARFRSVSRFTAVKLNPNKMERVGLYTC